MRVVLADDTMLLREGVAMLLGEAGFDVAGQAGNAEELIDAVGEHKPEVAIVDLRMPPTHTDEGLQAALAIRAKHPKVGVLVLSQHADIGLAMKLLDSGAEGVGYMLKDRVSDLEDFADAIRRVAAGGSALDPTIVSQLLSKRREAGPLDDVTAREREVLELMAEGRSNQGIADRLGISERGVQKHVTSIFDKLGIPAGHRRPSARSRRTDVPARVVARSHLRTCRGGRTVCPGALCAGTVDGMNSVLLQTSTVVEATGLVRRYGQGETCVNALRGVDVGIASGQLTAVMGPSGSGKSTLMHILAGLDRPTEGSVTIGGQDITKLGDDALTLLRREHIGFIFQFFNLLPMLTAAENVVLPLSLAGRKPDREWVDELTEKVGLTDRLGHRPSELSGGQQQRVAIARALVSRPTIMFADEPTGNLDSRTGGEILELLRHMVSELGQTTVMVTHDAHAAAIADRVLFLADGEIVRDLGPSDAHTILDTLEQVTSR